MADTAALIENLDLVIAVDTAVCHLAGALGKPVWTLTAAIPHWGLGMQPDRTPWYPTMRLFRQQTANDGAGVIQRVAAALRSQFS
jgi:ADP-heptose:LPS heptosyltransferase